MQGSAQEFLSTNGKAIVNESGDTILLRGMGLGGWMLQEGYMMHTSSFANAQYQLMGKIEELIGATDTDLFYESWRANHVTKVDIDSLKPWGNPKYFWSFRSACHGWRRLTARPFCWENAVPGKNWRPIACIIFQIGGRDHF